MANFQINSDKIRVTDPCYTKDTWCAGVLENCVSGEWFAERIISNEGSWGNRVAEICIWNKDYIGEVDANELTDIDVGVDSGQAGFFDEDQYPDGETGEYGQLDTFYGQVCDQTEGTDIANVGFGVTTSSGFGDGGYNCYIGKNSEGKIVAAKIVFIGEEEDEEDYDCWDDEDTECEFYDD